LRRLLLLLLATLIKHLIEKSKLRIRSCDEEARGEEME
jgi:hypothetical protein